MSEVENYPELPVDYSPDTGVLVFGNQDRRPWAFGIACAVTKPYSQS